MGETRYIYMTETVPSGPTPNGCPSKLSPSAGITETLPEPRRLPGVSTHLRHTSLAARGPNSGLIQKRSGGACLERLCATRRDAVTCTRFERSWTCSVAATKCLSYSEDVLRGRCPSCVGSDGRNFRGPRKNRKSSEVGAPGQDAAVASGTRSRCRSGRPLVEGRGCLVREKRGRNGGIEA